MDFITYGLTFIALIITLGAQAYVNGSYKKYTKKESTLNMTGAEIARKVLDKNGLESIGVEETDGYLSDHYDPKGKVVRLSSTNYHGSSISAISVSSHECGHAIQDRDGYIFMRHRASLVGIVNFSSRAGYFAILLGVLFSSPSFILLGIFAEIMVLVFQLVTLPVEFDASNRALKELDILLPSSETKQSKKVLTAAALTYVASVAAAVLEVVRLIMIYGNRRDND